MIVARQHRRRHELPRRSGLLGLDPVEPDLRGGRHPHGNADRRSLIGDLVRGIVVTDSWISRAVGVAVAIIRVAVIGIGAIEAGAEAVVMMSAAVAAAMPTAVTAA